MAIHLKVSKGDIAERVIVAGDPERVRDIAEELLVNAKVVNRNRGLLSYTGVYEGVRFSVVTHGIGGPSATIVLEELIKEGAKAIIRLGSCGALTPDLKLGDVVIPTTAAYYPGGMYYQYYGEVFCGPSAPDYELLNNLVNSCKSLNLKFMLGPVMSSEAFYAESQEFTSKCRRRGIIAVEMECAPLFMIGAIRGVKVASLLLVSNSLVTDIGFASAKELRPYAIKAARAAFNALLKTRV